MKQLRERAGLELLEAAFRIKKSEATVRFWETGRTEPKLSPEETLRVLKVYGCTLDELAAAVSETRAAAAAGK